MNLPNASSCVSFILAFASVTASSKLLRCMQQLHEFTQCFIVCFLHFSICISDSIFQALLLCHKFTNLRLQLFLPRCDNVQSFFSLSSKLLLLLSILHCFLVLHDHLLKILSSHLQNFLNLFFFIFQSLQLFFRFFKQLSGLLSRRVQCFGELHHEACSSALCSGAIKFPPTQVAFGEICIAKDGHCLPNSFDLTIALACSGPRIAHNFFLSILQILNCALLSCAHSSDHFTCNNAPVLAFAKGRQFRAISLDVSNCLCRQGGLLACAKNLGLVEAVFQVSCRLSVADCRKERRYGHFLPDAHDPQRLPDCLIVIVDQSIQCSGQFVFKLNHNS